MKKCAIELLTLVDCKNNVFKQVLPVNKGTEGLRRVQCIILIGPLIGPDGVQLGLLS